MPTARTPRTPAPNRVATRSTPARNAKTTVDEVATQLDRVLKVTQPKEKLPRITDAPRKPTIPSAPRKPTASAPTTTTTSKPIATASSTATTSTKAVKAVVRPKVTTAPLATAKGKEKAIALPDWADDKSSLTSSQRARGAFDSVAAANKTLTEVQQSGWKVAAAEGTAETSSKSSIWTIDKVRGIVASGVLAIEHLRRMVEDASLAKKASDVERSAQILATYCAVFGMLQEALDIQKVARPYILRLVDPRWKDDVRLVSAVPVRNDGPSGPGEKRPGLEKAKAKPDGASFSAHRHLLSVPKAIWSMERSEDVKNVICKALCNSWAVIIGLYQPPIDLIPLPSLPNSPDDQHPLRSVLACALASTSALTSVWYRELASAKLPHADPRYLHYRTLAVFAMASGTSVSQAPKAGPSRVWLALLQTVRSYLRTDESARPSRATSDVIARVIDWVIVICSARAEQEADWCTGKEWIELMDVWVSIGRRMNDSKIIDRALAGMAGSTSIAGPSTPPRSSNSDAKSHAPSNPARKTPRLSPDQAEVQVVKISGLLAKANLAVESYTDARSAANTSAMLAALDGARLAKLPSALTSLPDTDDGEALFAKAGRGVERVRRGCSKLLPASGSDTELSAVAERSSIWMLAAVEAVELIDQAPSAAQMSHVDLIAGAIDSLTALSRLGTDSSFDQLRRAHALSDGCSKIASVHHRIDWVRCISSTAYNRGSAFWRSNDIAKAVLFARASSDWGKEAVDLARKAVKEGEEVEDKLMTSLREGAVKRFEFLGSALHKHGDKVDAVASMMTCLTLVPLEAPQSSGSNVTSTSNAPITGTFVYTVDRIASVVSSDPALHGDFVSTLARTIGEARMSAEDQGLILEALVQAFEAFLARDQMPSIILKLAELAIQTYDAGLYPVRRLRCITRLMSLILATGQRAERFEALHKEVVRLGLIRELRKDEHLANHKAEYLANAALLNALHSKYTEPSPTTILLNAQSALATVRDLVIQPSTAIIQATPVTPIKSKLAPLGNAKIVPPAAPGRGRQGTLTSRTVSEPQVQKKIVKVIPKAQDDTLRPRKSLSSPAVLQDVGRLTGLLLSLVGLLGISGHVLTKVDTLRLIRTILRGRVDQFDPFIQHSAELATEYSQLGKHTRANVVFNQTIKTAEDNSKDVSLAARVELHLRHAAHLANTDQVVKARIEWRTAADLAAGIAEVKLPVFKDRVLLRMGELHCAALARTALAAMCLAEDNASDAILHFAGVYRLRIRAAEGACRLAVSVKVESKIEDDDPFAMSAKPKITGQDEPAKDDQPTQSSAASHFKDKHLHGLQWRVAENLIGAALDLAYSLGERGSPRECEYYLRQAMAAAEAVSSDVLIARITLRQADLHRRLRKSTETTTTLEKASALLSTLEGPDVIELHRIEGDLMVIEDRFVEAHQAYTSTSEGLGTLEDAFTYAEETVPSPRKRMLSTSISKSRFSGLSQNEPLLPIAWTHVVRQQAWLHRSAGDVQAAQACLVKLKAYTGCKRFMAEGQFLEGRLALREAFDRFKSDLFMSSLTESTISLPMGNPAKRPQERQSMRGSAQIVLQRAEAAYHDALDLVARSGRAEDVRQACMAMTLLCAYQTSLGIGSRKITATAASILASTSAITLQRELLEAIEYKFRVEVDDIKWLQIDDRPKVDEALLDIDDGRQLRAYWAEVKERHSANHFLNLDAYDLSPLPSSWAVISINVTDDHNTMFISRHQKGHQPLVFCLPLDRQSRRECDEEDVFSFDAGAKELRTIITESDTMAKAAKGITERAARAAWWTYRYDLDRRMKSLVESIEFCWLGAFKTILAPRSRVSPELIDEFRNRLQRIFDGALANHCSEIKRGAKVHLDDTLLECFIHLDPKCKDEELDDLVYFILDVYQFHGIQFSVAELDMDMLIVDVRDVIADFEPRLKPSTNENLFLALDKDVSGFPWESIPILRGRAVSRIPSLPFLLDQISFQKHLNPPVEVVEAGSDELRRIVSTKRVFYILNPSGDLTKTQEVFTPWLDAMEQRAGWKGIRGRPPTELELLAALKDYELVLYFGHGGAEQYARAHKVRHLTRCAATMLWGCSSGALRDQGDMDRSGTPWNYMVAGCPSLVANLWDVTDRDIDRLCEEVFRQLNLDTAHVPDHLAAPPGPGPKPGLLSLNGLSTVQAVNLARNECKLQYLTGAAPVIYGIPVYLH